MIVNSFDTNLDFLKTNPQLKIIPEFKELSSKELWSIALLYDPDSKFFNLPIKERQTLIAKEYLKDPKYKFESINKAINIYLNLSITPALRQLIEWRRVMDQKSEFLKTVEYAPDTYEMIEDMLKSNTSLYKELERLELAITKQNKLTGTKGGSMESASEQGLI